MSFTVLGLLGQAGSGKDLVADWLSEHGYVKIALADPMKRFVMYAFEFTHIQLWGPSQERNKEIPITTSWWFEAAARLPTAFGEILNRVLDGQARVTGYLEMLNWFTQLRKDYPDAISARVVLQTLGTEWGRTVDPLLWAKYVWKQAAEISQGADYSQAIGLRTHRIPRRIPQGIAVPDHRFINEVETTQANNGYVIKLVRPGNSKTAPGIQGHTSETEQQTIPNDKFDLVLELPEGVENVYAVLEGVLKERAWETKRKAG